MHSISNLFYFGTTLYMFWMVSPSIIRSLRLYIQYQVYVIQVLWLLASGNESSISFLLASSHRTCMVCYCMYRLRLLMMDKRPSETCRVLFQNKINLRYCASGWFIIEIYYDARCYKHQNYEIMFTLSDHMENM